MVSNFLHGLLIGLLASMPVGALAILSVQRTLNAGIKAGFIIGLGAAVGDLIYATFAAFGISQIADFIAKYEFYMAFAGSLILIFMGVKVYRSDTIKQFRRKTVVGTKKLIGDFFSSLILALSNPFTILGFGGFFATFGFSKELQNFMQTFILLAGIFSGAVIWWFSVSYFVSKFKHKFTLRRIVMINKIAGFLIALLGVGLLFFILFFKSKLA